jgi:Pyridoxamine 5'-phosphate oxidase
VVADDEPIDPTGLLQFMREHPLAVQSSAPDVGRPQSAVVGIAVSDAFEVVFDTDAESRKVRNLREAPGIALVIGGTEAGDERSVQYEGVADEPEGAELERLQELYFQVFPDGRARQRWRGITYIRARPTWIRYTDFNRDPPEVVEFDRATLAV